ncbi:MAG: sigma-70 family RNA polymerase sigma factor [Hyphomicrobiales bacterium]
MRNKSRVLEEYLVTSARLGDKSAFAQLVELRGPRLLAHASRLLQNREEARDVTQEAWLDILRSLRSLRDPAAFPAWATRIVTRRCARFIKAQQKQRVLKAELTQEVKLDAIEHPPDANDAEKVRAAISALPPKQAATIALFYLEDMSVGEIAMALDVPRGTVKTRLMHAREKLKNVLKGDTDE